MNTRSEYLGRIAKENQVTIADLDRYIESHKINIGYLRSDDFDKFFISRAKELLDLISGAMGKTISNRDSDEIIAVFGDKL